MSMSDEYLQTMIRLMLLKRLQSVLPGRHMWKCGLSKVLRSCYSITSARFYAFTRCSSTTV